MSTLRTLWHYWTVVLDIAPYALAALVVAIALRSAQLEQYKSIAQANQAAIERELSLDDSQKLPPSAYIEHFGDVDIMHLQEAADD
jgi:hypothetical protein